MTFTPNIVTLNVSVTEAPLPSTLQQSGAFVTQGGTTTPPGTLTLVADRASLTAILAPQLAISSLAWSGGVVTATTAAPHGFQNGLTFAGIISGASPSGYNGNYALTVTGASTLTYPLTPNPGSETIPGFVQTNAALQLEEMGNTFFAGLNQQAPYVLELGLDTVTNGVGDLQTFIDDNPGVIYSYLVPRTWNNNSAFEAFLTGFEAPNKMTYFFVTIATGDVTGAPPVTVYAGNKAVLAAVEAPGVQAGQSEFSLASPFATTLGFNPSSTNRISPLSYAPAYGCTAYPTRGNKSLFDTLAQASVGWISTGAEGGITSNIVKQGLLQDANQFIFWYSADWFQINSQLALANEVINGSVPGGNPLYYDQDGINRLQNRLATTARQAVANGLANGQVALYKLPFNIFQQNYNAGMYEGQIPINAEPFLVYAQANPSDYRVGKYGGLSCVYTPTLGFLNIFFNLNITNLLIP